MNEHDVKLHDGEIKNILWMIQNVRPENVDHALNLAQLRAKLSILIGRVKGDSVPEGSIEE